MKVYVAIISTIGCTMRKSLILLLAAFVVTVAFSGAAAADQTKDIETDGNETEIIDRDEESRQVLEASASTSDVDVDVVVGRDYEWSYSSDGTVDIWAGAMNQSGTVTSPVADVSLTIEVEDPNGNIETFTRTTGADGNVHIGYSLAGKPDGEYSVRVNSSNSEEWASFKTGEMHTIYPQISDTAEVGREVSAAVRVTEGNEPVTNTETTVEIVSPDGSQETRTVSTDGSGFATVAFTPTSTGTYEVRPVGSGEGTWIRAGEALADVDINGQDWGNEVEPEQTAHITGRIFDGGSPLASEEITLEIVNTTNWDNEEVVKTFTTTTDQFGQFDVQWQSSSTGDTRYEVKISTTNGPELVTKGYPDIEVEEATDDASDVSVDVDFTDDWPHGYKPGQSVSVDVSVEQNGAAVSNHDVTVAPVLGWENVPITTGEVTTGPDGTATYSFTVPDNAPVGADLRVQAGTTLDGEDASDTGYGDIQSYVLDEHRPSYTLTPGETFTYGVTATDPVTGSAVQDVPITVAAATESPIHGSVIGTDSARTNASGGADVSFTIPTDSAGGELYLSPAHAYESGYPTFRINAYDVSLSGLDQYEYTAGDSVSVSYSADTTADVSGILVVHTHNREHVKEPVILSKRVSPGESTTLTLPSVSDDSYFDVDLYTLTTNGKIAKASDHLSVTPSSTANEQPTASFTASPSSLTVGEEVTFDASDSTDSDGSIASYAWDFDGDGETDATGSTATTTHTYSEAGTYSATLTVTDDEGATDTATKTITVESDSQDPASVGIELQPTTADVSTNSTHTVDVVATNVTDGIGSYDVTVGLNDTAVATVSNVSLYGNPLQGGSTDIAADGSSVTFTGSVTDTKDTGEVTIATLTLATQVPGTVATSTTVATIGNESGESLAVTGITEATVTVQNVAQPPAVVGDNRPTDTDGDGTFDDVNGDGSFDVNDVTALWANRNSDAIENNPTQFDVNGDGSFDVNDVTALWNDYLVS